MAERTHLGVPEALIVRAARAKVPGWAAAADDAAFTLQPLHGGMSNLMFIVSNHSAGAVSHRRVVARLLSPALDAVIDRERESRIVRYLATSGIGPLLFGTCSVAPDGALLLSPAATPRAPASDDARASPRAGPAACTTLRFEAFIDGRTLTVRDLRDAAAAASVRAHTAAKLAALHAQRPDLREREERARLRRASACSLDALPPPLQPLPQLRPALQRYVDMVAAIGGHARMRAGAATPALRELLRGGARGVCWPAEAAWLARLMEAHGGPTVLCHGDAQPGNWIEESRGPHGSVLLKLIDYEYARYDHRAVDTGNLFCEIALDYNVAEPPGFVMDVGCYPPLEHQRDWLGHYAAAARDAAAAGSEGHASGGAAGSGGPPHEAAATPLPPPPDSECDGGCSGGGGGGGGGSVWQRTTCNAAELARQFPDGADEGGPHDAPPGVGGGVRQLAREARLGMLASHLYWSLWSAIMGAGREGIAVPLPAAAPGGDAAGPAASGAAAGHVAGDDDASVSAGHGVFSYASYGLARLREYERLRAQLEADAPEWCA